MSRETKVHCREKSTGGKRLQVDSLQKLFLDADGCETPLGPSGWSSFAFKSSSRAFESPIVTGLHHHRRLGNDRSFSLTIFPILDDGMQSVKRPLWQVFFRWVSLDRHLSPGRARLNQTLARQNRGGGSLFLGGCSLTNLLLNYPAS